MAFNNTHRSFINFRQRQKYYDFVLYGSFPQLEIPKYIHCIRINMPRNGIRVDVRQSRIHWHERQTTISTVVACRQHTRLFSQVTITRIYYNKQISSLRCKLTTYRSPFSVRRYNDEFVCNIVQICCAVRSKLATKAFSWKIDCD